MPPAPPVFADGSFVHSSFPVTSGSVQYVRSNVTLQGVRSRGVGVLLDKCKDVKLLDSEILGDSKERPYPGVIINGRFGGWSSFEMRRTRLAYGAQDLLHFPGGDYVLNDAFIGDGSIIEFSGTDAHEDLIQIACTTHRTRYDGLTTRGGRIMQQVNQRGTERGGHFNTVVKNCDLESALFYNSPGMLIEDSLIDTLYLRRSQSLDNPNGTSAVLRNCTIGRLWVGGVEQQHNGVEILDGSGGNKIGRIDGANATPAVKAMLLAPLTPPRPPEPEPKPDPDPETWEESVERRLAALEAKVGA